MIKDERFKDKFFMDEKEWKKFHKSLNKAVAACSKSIEEVGDAFGKGSQNIKEL